MIRVGLSAEEKLNVIREYMLSHSIEKVKLFYPEKFPLDFPEAEHIEYADIIMYKFFYRLLEEIDNTVLLVFNECMRTQNRSDLTYNCAHHYCNQTEHKIIFEHFPFIDDDQNFMILLDMQNKGRYKGKSFNSQFLRDEDTIVKPVKFSLEIIDVAISNKDREKYEAKKEQLFSELGTGDPDTIPRQLHIWAGNLKKKDIGPFLHYVARNDRFKLPEVTTYKAITRNDYIIIDFPHRRIDFNDFLKTTGITTIKFLSTDLKVDRYYINKLQSWIDRLEALYAQASIYP